MCIRDSRHRVRRSDLQYLPLAGSYALSGTEAAYLSTTLCGTELAYGAMRLLRMCGTELAYAATLLLCGVWYKASVW
eukprot:3940237-Rhodomonas_salina.1